MAFNEDALQKDVSMLVVYWMKIKICIIRIILIIEDDNGMKPVIHEESPVSIGKRVPMEKSFEYD